MKKFTWIFGLALLWGGLNAVAQTTKNVGTFADLKKAVDNIPQFKVVQEKKTAYNDAKADLATAEAKTAAAKAAYDKVYPNIEAAKNDWDDAKTATADAKRDYDEKHGKVTEAQGVLSTAETSASNARTAYNNAKKDREDALEAWNTAIATTKNEETKYNAAQKDREAITDSVTTTTDNERSSTLQRCPGFKELVAGASGKGSTLTSPTMYYGIIESSFNIIIFVNFDIKSAVETKVKNEYGVDIIWYKKEGDSDATAIAPVNLLKEKFSDLDKLVTQYKPEESKFYYKEIDGSIGGSGDDYEDGDGNFVFDPASLNTVAKILARSYTSNNLQVYPLEEVTTTKYTEKYQLAKDKEEIAYKAWQEAKADEDAKKATWQEAREAERDAQTELSLAQNEVITAGNAVTAAQNEEKPYYDAYVAAQNEEKAAKAAYDKAVADAADLKGAWDDAKEEEEPFRTAVETAKSNYNTEAAKIAKDENPENKDSEGLIICEDEYKTISITGMITVKDVTGEHIWKEWPAGYTLNGNGNSIKYEENVKPMPLFDISKGEIRNIANIQTSIAKNVMGDGLVVNCLTRRGDSYRAYISYTDYTDYTSVEEAIYKTQGENDFKFGYDMDTKSIKPLDENGDGDYRLYQAHYANNANKTTYDFKLNIRSNNNDDEKLKYDKTTFNNKFKDGLTYDNAILYIDDKAAAEKIGDMKNVAVMEDGTYTCHNTELKDGTSAKGFYVPMPFKAENLSYDRSFSSSSLATVCLPFSVSKKTLEAAGVTQVMQFDNVDSETNTYWFRYLEDGDLKANEPCVLKFNENFTGGTIFADLKDINVAATVGINQLAVQPSNPGEGAEFRGVFVATNATELANGGNLYGFAEGKFRPLKISEDTKFSPFRTYVRASRESNVPAVTFNIGELDEDGNIVSDGGETGVTTAVKEADAFSVKGINGALVITSDKAQKVNVYTIGGSLVKATNVEAGSVTVPVAAGVYVVNGKKVFVK